MSADNGVYICKFKDGYRVIEACAIENLDYFEPGSWEEKEEWRNYWGKAPVFPDKNDAIIAAHEMAESIDVLEYGVVLLRGNGVEWKDWKAPNDPDNLD